jgi:hypothetical protein
MLSDISEILNDFDPKAIESNIAQRAKQLSNRKQYCSTCQTIAVGSEYYARRVVHACWC